MLLAVVSAFCRGGLNLIDRYQIGINGLSIAKGNFWNNSIPAVAVVTLAAATGLAPALFACFMDARTALFGALAQAVAYAFSYAFRRLNVSQVMVAGKAADFFIPVAVFFSSGYWDWATYGFAVATTLVCLPLLRGHPHARHPGDMKAAALLIGGALTLQGGIAPLLAGAAHANLDARQALGFAFAVIVWRMVWSLLPMLRIPGAFGLSSCSLLRSPLLFHRALLSVATQATFVLAVGNSASALAWPILNSTGLIAMVLSSLLLKEAPSASQKWAVVMITALALLRFLSL